MTFPKLKPREILYEDNHLLVIDKPAGIATMGALEGEPTIHAMAGRYIKDKYNKPGNVFVGIVSRLDAMTTGVLVLARTSKAAGRLSQQFAPPKKGDSKKKKNQHMVVDPSVQVSRRKVMPPARKLYLAAVEGDWQDTFGLLQTGSLSDRVFKDDSAHRMRVCRGTQEGQFAELNYVVLASFDGRTVLAVELVTGRKHQIRLQFAERGHPVIGDRKYGSRTSFVSGLALHCWQLLITHPTQGTPMRLVSDLPNSWTGRMASEPPLRQSLIEDSLDWDFGVDLP